MRIVQIVFFVLFCSRVVSAMEYHVSIDGSNQNPGTKDQPFRTIQKAATVAIAGDVVTVHQGVYREWVSPVNGGYDAKHPILYQVAEGEEVYIKGSEVVSHWHKEKGNVWKSTVDNSLFGDFNPFDVFVEGDWLSTPNMYHLGEVYLDGKSLYEVSSVDQLINPVPTPKAQDKEASLLQWHAEVGDQQTVIYANFGDINPNRHLIEINVRPACFFPKQTGVNFITLRGFHVTQAATQWAPPTGEQIGAIGPHWSKGWIIENNVVSNSKCTGISLGKERASGLNESTHRIERAGFHRQIETVFAALDLGWSKERIGSHIVRFNTIFDCGQTGICGHMGAAFSKITNNKIYDINKKKQIFGAEVAGIKLHAPIDVVIAHNCVINCYKAIWLDWEAQGTRVTGNLFAENEWQDIFVEVSHGPTLIDNNICLSHNSITIASHGVAAVHNLFGGTIRTLAIEHRFTPYHLPHSTKIKGMCAIGGGDHRFYNNLFVSDEDCTKKLDSFGLDAFNNYPVLTDSLFYTRDPKDMTFGYPMFCGQNAFFNKAQPYKWEVGSRIIKEPAEVFLERRGDGLYLHINLSVENLTSMNTQWITTAKLGTTYVSEAEYENSDGTPLIVVEDFFGKKRRTKKPLVGPFDNFDKKVIKLF